MLASLNIKGFIPDYDMAYRILGNAKETDLRLNFEVWVLKSYSFQESVLKLYSRTGLFRSLLAWKWWESVESGSWLVNLEAIAAVTDFKI